MSYYRSRSDDSWASILGGLFVLFVILFFAFGLRACNRAGGFGPEASVKEATVITKHVDAGKNSSSYMVTTDKGTYEVDNGFLLGIWNADEIYGVMEVGKTYNLTVEGEKTVWWFIQYYPYITKVEEVKKP
jgi:hypothetical protein